MKTFGSKAEVWHSTALKTRGQLRKKDLVRNKYGRIVSRKKQAAGKKAIKHLRALGYIAKKGTFKLMRKSMVDGRRKKSKKQTKKQSKKRGGAFGIVDSFAGGSGESLAKLLK